MSRCDLEMTWMMYSAPTALWSLLSLGQRPRELNVIKQALKARLNNIGGVIRRRAAGLTRAFSAYCDFYFIPGALPQAKI
jgi:hypothetical protein